MARISIFVEAIGPRAAVGYEVFVASAGQEPKAIGRVLRVQKESHIRRGRMQASPWWRPVNGAGIAVGERTSRGDVVDYQKRLDAIDRLLAYRELPAAPRPRRVAPSNLGSNDG